MNRQNITGASLLIWGVIVIFLFISLQMGIAISQSDGRPFAVFSICIIAIFALTAFMSPVLGLSLLVVQCMFTDEFKRIAVVKGGGDIDLVTIILVGPLVTICAMNFSIFMKSVVFKMMKVERDYWYMIGAIIVLTIAMFVGGEGDYGPRGQFAFNVGLYLTLLPLIGLLLPTLEKWKKFIFLQLILAIPSALWGIKQYFFGFTEMEWEYARTGLSQTHTIQMLLFEHPRVFGFLGSASAFGCMSLYGTYSFYQFLVTKKHRALYFFMGVIFMVAVVCATQRSMLLIPFIILVSYSLMLSKARTVIFYAVMTILLVLGIVNSTWLLDEGIVKVNAAIHAESGWGQEVLNVSTFSDRLKGWENFMDPATWSLFGTGASSVEEYDEKGGHDLVNKILIKAGVAGLFAVIVLVFFVLRTLHRIVWRAPNRELKKEGAFLLACFVPLLMMNLMGGGEFEHCSHQSSDLVYTGWHFGF